MKRLSVTLALALAGCRPPAPPVAATPVQSTQPRPAPAQPDTRPDVEPEVSEVVAIERDTAAVGPPGVPPPGVDAPESACEQACGDVHDCALVERAYTPAAAAAIELGCIGACLRTSERTTLFGCRRPTAIEPEACSPFLACVDADWPAPSDGESESTIEAPVEPGGGCVRTCEAFARCWDPTTASELIVQCVEGCQRELDDEQERRFGTCAELPNCVDILNCVAQTPGA